MTRDDKEALRSHSGRLVLHLNAGDHYVSVREFPTLHLTTSTWTPKKDDMADPDGESRTVWTVNDCGEFDCLSDAVFVLKTTGRLVRGPLL